jgi:ABC-type sugar transport system permease subunit
MTSVKTSSRPSGTTSSASSVAEKLSLKSARPTPAKQVRLKLVYIDFWSAVKFSFLISAALGVVLFVAVILIWTVLASTGVFDQIGQLAGDVSGQKNFSINSVVSFAQVMGFTLVIAALNVVVGTVLGAIACVLYNLSVRVSGGILVGFTNQ